MATWSERYEAGDRQRVWQELHSLGPLTSVSRGIRDDVEKVARRTMERVVWNIGSLHERLVSIGYEFDDPELSFAPELVATKTELLRLTAYVDTIPPAVEALLSSVGRVSFRGWLPSAGSIEDWRGQYVDPLEILINIPGDIEYHRERCLFDGGSGEVPQFELTIAGDYLHKNEVSGGGPTFIRLPFDEADGQVIEDDGLWFREWMAKRRDKHTFPVAEKPPPAQPIWLVDYLRMYFDCGGFRRVPGTRSYPDNLVRTLSEGLLQI